MKPRIYVACLTAYNNGVLHGSWINANQDEDRIQEEINNVIESSPFRDAEEWAIHDHEGFGNIPHIEHEPPVVISKLAKLIDEYGPIFTALLEHTGDVEKAIGHMEESYQGCYDNESEWARSFLEETCELDSIPSHLRGYFDYEAYARDCELNGDIFTIDHNGETHVFYGV